MPARFVRWRYLLPWVVPEMTALPSRLDVHRAAQLFVAGTWVLVDPAHHAGLSGTPLLVNDWDGVHDTRPSYPPVGPMMVEDKATAAVSEAIEDVRRWTANCPESVLASWRSAYIAWLRQHE